MSYVFSLIGGLLGITNIIVRILIGWFQERLFISELMNKIFFFENIHSVATNTKKLKEEQSDDPSDISKLSKIGFENSRDIEEEPPNEQ